MNRSKKNVMLFMLVTLLLSACQPKNITSGGESRTLNVMTHDSFSVSEQVILDFEEKYQVKINFLLSGDTGAALNRAILTKDSPQADVFYGVDNTFMSRALSEDIFESYASSGLVDINDDLKLDPTNRLLPVDYGDVCINYDKAFFLTKQIPVPDSLNALIEETYKGLLVVENPATSSPGLAFLMATIAEFGEDGYIEYWKKLKENGLIVVNDWETGYYTNFSGSSGKGSQPMVVSYSTSPAAEVIFSETPLSEAPTSSIIADNSCFRQIEFVGILSGTNQRELAEKFVDFMLGIEFQEDLPMQMFVFPANRNAKLPVEFTKYIEIPASPASLDPDLIASNREKWIETWTSEILR